MLMPKKVKYRKQQKGKRRGKAWRGGEVTFGDYGLKALEPAWVTDRRVDPKDIFRKLTSINVTAFCDQCDVNKQGMVIVDNVVFEK